MALCHFTEANLIGPQAAGTVTAWESLRLNHLHMLNYVRRTGRKTCLIACNETITGKTTIINSTSTQVLTLHVCVLQVANYRETRHQISYTDVWMNCTNALGWSKDNAQWVQNKTCINGKQKTEVTIRASRKTNGLHVQQSICRKPSLLGELMLLFTPQMYI